MRMRGPLQPHSIECIATTPFHNENTDYQARAKYNAPYELTTNHLKRPGISLLDPTARTKTKALADDKDHERKSVATG